MIEQPELTVAVWMVAYNHERYISKAIESIISQETSFHFRLFIGEDCSTDSTRTICQQYTNRFPEKISLILQTHNTGGYQNAMSVYKACFGSGAKYIALLEGDDYWTDPLKLQKQVDLLEDNPNAGFCFSKASVIFETEQSDHRYLHMDAYPKVIALEDYLDNYYPIPIPTKIFRCSLIRPYWTDEWKWSRKVRFFDNLMHMCDLMQGDAIFLNETTAAYRVHGQSVTRLAPKQEVWHIEEILLTHYHFVDLAPDRFKEKFKAIRAFHFEKLLDFWISQKDVAKVLASTMRYLKDDRSGTVSSKLSTISRVLKKHWKARFN